MKLTKNVVQEERASIEATVHTANIAVWTQDTELKVIFYHGSMIFWGEKYMEAY